ncbi:MAG: glycosyltransferase family 1 protein [Burkholderiales bacterium]|nr:MAG: glycosyltransferase family 1 protein [Burkholderiales bacterium]
MRIAVVSNTAWYLSNFRLNLMLALKAAGHEVIAVAPTDGYAGRISAAGISFEPVPITGGGTQPLVEARSVVRLHALLRRRRVDLVLSYTPKGNLYSALACLPSGRPFVPNVSGLGRAFVRGSLVTVIARLLYRLTFRRAAHVFFQNHDDMRVFLEAGFVLPSRAERLPGSGVDLTRFTAQPPPSHAAGGLVFLLVARMLWDKGIGEYVEAARLVRLQHPRARFQLLGFLDVANPSAISREQMAGWVSEGVIEYLGTSDDVRPFLAQADCIVLPSKYREGVPRTLLEAGASSRPLVTTDAPGCRDTVIDGTTGFLCVAGNAPDLADKLLRVMALSPHDRRLMGERSHAHIAAHFDETRVLDSYLGLIRKMVVQNPVAGAAASATNQRRH